MMRVRFVLLDEENDMVHVEHDGIEVWGESARDRWDQYFRHVMPRGVPVLLTTDVAEADAQDDERSLVDGEDTGARLMRWLAENGADPLIRPENDEGETEIAEITMTGADLHWLIYQAAERFYWHGVDDVHGRQ